MMMKKSKMIKNADYGEILKRFEYTVREYIKFYDYYRNQNISSETPDAFYIMLQTKLMILRKYDYNREEIYLEKVFEAINQEYPDLKDESDVLKQCLQELSNYCMEVILSDGTSLNLYRAIEDVMYGVYLHADSDKIGRLLNTNKSVYLTAVKEYITILEKIVIDTYNLIVDKMQDKYIYQKENSASVIFMGDSTNEKHDIKNSPYWKNLYGKDLQDTKVETIFKNMTKEDMEIYTKGLKFLREAYKEDYSVELLEELVFPWVRSDWGDFSGLHNFVIEKKNIGLSSRVQYNDKHDIAYLKIFQNVENAFVVEQPHQIPDIWILNFVKENEKYGWRIYGIGEKIINYKE